MASARKTYARSKSPHLAVPSGERSERACFINDLVDGTISATAMREVRAGNGRLIRIEYDDPRGSSGAGNGRTGRN